jgi:hypothetical protein
MHLLSSFWRRFNLLVVLLACMALGAATSIARGQDVNWDLRNYHLSTAWRYLSGHFDQDLMISGLQSYFNPTLDLPYVYLAMGPLASHPRALAGLMGVWYGALLFVLWRLAWRLMKGRAQASLWTIAATFAAATGAATVSQIGTTMNEVPLGLMVVAGVLALLPALPDDRDGKVDYARVGIAGLLFGLAAGAKLTVCVYAPAVCLALLFVLPWRRWLAASATFSGAWLIGFLPPFLWWGRLVAARFESPTFPLFNALFRSSFYPPTDFFDRRFMPRDALQTLFYPFYWAFRTRSGVIAELGFKDPRLAAAMLVFALVGVAWFVARRRQEKPALPRTTLFVILFTTFAYIAWEATSSILRYAVALEALATLGLVAALPYLVRVFSKRAHERLALALGLALCVGLVGGTKAMDWGHIPFGKRVFDVDMSWTEPNTLFLPITGPSAYLAAFVPEDRRARFVGFSFTTLDAEGWTLADATREAIRTHTGPIVVLVPHGMMDFAERLPAAGLRLQSATCRPVVSNLDAPFKEPVTACHAQKI